MPAGLLEVRNLTHRFDSGRYGLEDVGMTVPGGSFTVIAGSNGSGKTLLLKHLVGLEIADEGEILLDGAPVDADWAKTRERIGFVFQDADAQIIEATVGEEVAFAPKQKRLKKPELQTIVRDALVRCQLDGRENELTSVLSGGEKRRLTMAGVLAQGVEILLLDEPFTGLDQSGSVRVLQILQEWVASGKTAILITHELEKCLAHADQLVLMKDGKTIAAGSVEDVWDRIPSAGVHRPRVDRLQWRSLTWLDR